MQSVLSEFKKPAHQLLEYIGKKGSILIMCHNNPDPDTVASALALKSLFYQAKKRKTIIGYGGIIGRAENRQLVKRLKIDMVHVRDIELKDFNTVCLVDSQPGTGNNSIPRKYIPHVVIDHHPLRRETKKCPLYDVRPRYGSSSTIMTEYLREMDCKIDKKLATALFYGLKADTNELLRSSVKADLEAFNFLFPLTAPRTLAAIENPSVPKSYYLKFAAAIDSSVQYRDVIVSSMGKLNNPEIVPEMADFLLRMEGIRWTLCFGEYQNDLILSVRTSRKGILASQIVIKLVRGLGTGGGHEKAAAGRIQLSRFQKDGRQNIERRITEKFLRAVGVSEEEPRPLKANSP